MEATIAFLAYVSVLGIFATAISVMTENMRQSELEINSALHAQECAGIIDSMSSNEGVEFHTKEFSCIVEEGTVVSIKNGKIKMERPLNQNVELRNNSGKISINVKGAKHYEE